jgi:peptidoglycan/xylan/chitin deacetylase (PgdA/CDA1 family)
MTALMYHDVVAPGADDASGFPGRDAALYKVTPETFAAHLDAIARATGRVAQPRSAGYRLGGAARRGCSAPVDPRDPVITFDDGGGSAIAAADLLDRYGFKGHFFVTVNYIGTRGFVSEADIRELARRGHVVGSHSCSHPLRMGHCSFPQLLVEWSRSCAILSDIVGKEVRVASVPGGDFSIKVAEAAAAAGINQLFTSEPTCGTQQISGLLLTGRFTIQRWTTAKTAAALAQGKWLPRARQAVVWNAKKMTKRLGGERYLQLRKLLIGHGDEVRWGDMR